MYFNAKQNDDSKSGSCYFEFVYKNENRTSDFGNINSRAFENEKKNKRLYIFSSRLGFFDVDEKMKFENIIKGIISCYWNDVADLCLWRYSFSIEIIFSTASLIFNQKNPTSKKWRTKMFTSLCSQQNEFSTMWGVFVK